jgi:hypothetical protein
VQAASETAGPTFPPTTHLFREEVVVRAVADAAGPVPLLRQVHRRAHELHQHLAEEIHSQV